VSKRCKVVVTFHDIAFEHYPEFFSKKSRLWFNIIKPGKIAKKADHVLTVSDYTKQDIAEYYHLDQAKITTLYNGRDKTLSRVGDPEKLKLVKKKYNLPDKYILSVGTVEPRKNFKNLARAYLSLALEDENIPPLVIAGRKDPKIFTDVDFPNTDKIHFTGFFDDEDKAALFSLAGGFTLMSLLEGFGIPILEAMQFGLPILCSEGTVFHELDKSNKFIYAKPEDLGSIKTGLHQLFTQLEETIAYNTSSFDWDKSAQQLLKLMPTL